MILEYMKVDNKAESQMRQAGVSEQPEGKPALHKTLEAAFLKLSMNECFWDMYKATKGQIKNNS